MVADDSEDIRELLRFQLTRLGYRVVEAADGREAVEAVRKERPALILMDLTMPVLDGFEATRLIRRIKGGRAVVILAFTALSSGASRASALAAGCDDFVRKHIGMSELSALLARHLGGGRALPNS
ncbi:MAG TPA: response regulator [Pyrinomonadaceae bacterium]|jgi:CheY-like chemotaxis protein